MEIMELDCMLNEKQLDERRDRLANLIVEEKLIDLQRKRSAKDFKTRMDDIAVKIGDCSREIRSRTEKRPVECKREVDFSRGVEELVRTDTGEVVSTRVLTPSDRQGVLFEIPRAKESAE